MDRKEFLKNVCGLGVCGCVLNLPIAIEALHAEDEAAGDQRLVFARHQLSRMVQFISEDTTSEEAVGILMKTGRECAKLGKLHVNFMNDPDLRTCDLQTCDLRTCDL